MAIHAENLMDLIAGLDGWTMMAVGFLTTVGVGELTFAMAHSPEDLVKHTGSGRAGARGAMCVSSTL